MRKQQNLPINIWVWISSSNPIRIIAIVIIAIGIRIYLFYIFPIFITNDSGDYLAATRDIFYHMNFYSNGLRDVRLPGYPVLLTLTYQLTEMQSNRIVLLQTCIGILCVIFGFLIGYLLQSHLIAEVLALFLSINPIYLLFEHTLMTETLFLFEILAFLISVLICFYWKLNWYTGALLGFAFATCTLTRLNGLLFCMVMIMGIFILILAQKRALPNQVIFKQTSDKDIFYFITAFSLILILIIGPWLWRNKNLYNSLSIYNFSNRNLVIYKSFHGQIDNSLPILKKINNELNIEEVNWDWLWRFSRAYSTPESERIARGILLEQIINHPTNHLEDILSSFECFGGYCKTLSGNRGAVRYWFLYIINNPSLLHETNTKSWISTSNPDFNYVENEYISPILELWSNAGIFYLLYIRPFLLILYFVLVSLYIVYLFGNKGDTFDLHLIFIFLLSMGYLFTILLHSLTLSAADRFASIFDVILIIVIMLLLKRFRRTKFLDIRQKEKSIDQFSHR